MLQKILSIIDLELEVTLVGWILYEKSEDEARKPKHLLVEGVLLIYLRKVNIVIAQKENYLLFLDTLANRGLKY